MNHAEFQLRGVSDPRLAVHATSANPAWLWSIDGKRMVVHAGCQIWVDLPDNDIVYDLARGPIRAGAIVNVTALPGATFELAS